MNASSHNSTVLFNDGDVPRRSVAEFDLNSLLRRPAAAEFHLMWVPDSKAPDVFGFVHGRTDFSPQDCVDALLVDQQQRHGTESAIPAETYCAFLRNRINAPVPELEWQLIALEFLLLLRSNQSSSSVALQNLCVRFPKYQDQLAELSKSSSLAETHLIDPTCSTRSDLMPTAAHVLTEFHVPDMQAIKLRDPQATQLDFDDPDQSSLAYEPDSFVHDHSSLLGEVEPFTQLPPVILNRIENSLEELRFPVGEPLMRQGDPGDGLYFVTEGRVLIRSVDEAGIFHEITKCGAGSILGEMALLTDEPRTADVVALSTVTAKFLPAPLFHEQASEFPIIGRVLTQLLAQRLGHRERDALTGKRFGRYRIVRRLGRGGMAIVYQAIDEQTGALVALKMMSHRLVFDANALKLFQSEARMIEAFEHPNIVQMLGRFKAFRSFFIVLEFCDGISLDEFIRKNGPLRESQFRKVMAQLASALSYAHKNGVVHRDIKPSNVILTSKGDVKLMDFGLAKPVDTGESTSSNLIAGTPRFMAPEQLLGDPTDTRADLFSLGCTAWKLLTGNELITDTRIHDIQKRHENWRLPNVSHLSSEVGAFLTASLQISADVRTVDLDAISRW